MCYFLEQVFGLLFVRQRSCIWLLVLQFSPGAFGRMACRVAPFFSGISPEMAYRMNPSGSPETEFRNVYPHEIGVYAGASTVQVSEGKLSEPVTLGHNQKDAT
jgi:hypothetical protein